MVNNALTRLVLGSQLDLFETSITKRASELLKSCVTFQTLSKRKWEHVKPTIEPVDWNSLLSFSPFPNEFSLLKNGFRVNQPGHRLVKPAGFQTKQT